MEEPTNPKNSSIRHTQDDTELVEASNFIEDLQKASQEIKVGFQKKKPVSPSPAQKQRQISEEKIDQEEVKVENEILAKDWLREITDERQKLEEVYQQAESLRRKIQQRLDRIKNLEASFSRVKNELAHFQQIKKENQAFLEEIKNILLDRNF